MSLFSSCPAQHEYIVFLGSLRRYHCRSAGGSRGNPGKELVKAEPFLTAPSFRPKYQILVLEAWRRSEICELLEAYSGETHAFREQKGGGAGPRRRF